MISKEALEYLVELGRDEEPLVKIGGKTYSRTGLSPVMENMPSPLETSFLDSIVTYIKSDTDGWMEEPCQLIIEILSPSNVSVSTELIGNFRQRAKLIDCKAILPGKSLYDNFMDVEAFIIRAQSCFVPNDNIADVLKVVGNVSLEEAVNVRDDGISQQVTAKSGIARVEKTDLPRRVKLAPYRTFPEIEQPESEFILRAKKDNTGVYFALFEADGGAWRIEAMKRIKEYFENALQGVDGVVILG